MKFFSILRKEILESRRSVSLLTIILILPLFFGLLTASTESVIPQDTPLSLIPKDGSVAEEDMEFFEGFLDVVTDATLETSQKSAVSKLLREEAYLVVEIPPNWRNSLFEGDSIKVYVDGAMVPVSRIASLLADVITLQIKSSGYQGAVEVIEVGKGVSTAQYFAQTVVFFLSVIVALEVVPSSMIKEGRIKDRVVFSGSLYQLTFGKLTLGIFFVTVQVIVLYATQFISSTQYFPDSPFAFISLYLMTLYLCSISLSLVIFTGFRDLGKYLNLAFLTVVLVFSSGIYPAGFMPSGFQKLSVLLPTYYSSILIRTDFFRDGTLSQDYWQLTLGFSIFSIILLLSAVTYMSRKKR